MLIKDYMQGKDIKLSAIEVESLLKKVLGDELVTFDELFKSCNRPEKKEIIDWGPDVGSEVIEN